VKWHIHSHSLKALKFNIQTVKWSQYSYDSWCTDNCMVIPEHTWAIQSSAYKLATLNGIYCILHGPGRNPVHHWPLLHLHPLPSLQLRLSTCKLYQHVICIVILT